MRLVVNETVLTHAYEPYEDEVGEPPTCDVCGADQEDAVHDVWIDPDPSDLAERTEAGCQCPVNDSDACIRGNVYVPCESEYCGGACDLAGRCPCPLHSSPTHDSGYGGTFSL